LARFLCSQAVALALRGVPALYFSSLVAGENWLEGVKASGHHRAINRRKWSEAALEAALGEAASPAARVFRELTRMLLRRREHPAFHPEGEQSVLELPPPFFGFRRTAPDKSETVLCLFNFSRKRQTLRPRRDLRAPAGTACRELLRGRAMTVKEKSTLALEPYQAVWLLSL